MTVVDAPGIARLRCRAVSVPLGTGPRPAQLLRRLQGTPHLVALCGAWAGGGALVACAPLLVLPPGADAAATVGVQPTMADSSDSSDSSDADAIVGGGWFGWFGFDAPPSLAFYDHLLRWRDGQWSFEALWSDDRDAVLTARLDACTALLAHDGPDRRVESGHLTAFGGAALPRHLAAVERAVEWIRAGEIYQVNVCTRLVAEFTGDPVDLFADAIGHLEPRFGAFVDGGDRAVACLSPELFLRRRGRQVTTSPIKGTALREPGVGPDALRASVKDAAENVMIVDLMRNDLGRVCEIGSVRASSLLDIEPHPGVWHLVSSVSGVLRADVDDTELLAATFPPGSVTGAPKLRALDAIAELEAGPRGVYTGTVGFASPSWGTELAVAIRTFEISGDRIELGVGGGVTADSVPMREWHECLQKAAPLLAAIGAELDPSVAAAVLEPTTAQRDGGLLETVLVVDGAPVRLEDHVARLDRSSRELYGIGVATDTLLRALDAARGVTGRAALRIVRGADGGVAIDCRPLEASMVESSCTTVRGRSGVWRHKWADRGYLAGLERTVGTPLFVGADGSVLETTRGNVFLICPDGSLVTPPLRDDLLPGVTRRAILDVARDTGRPTSLHAFTTSQMQAHAAFWTSSLSGVVAIRSVDGVELPRSDGHLAAVRAALDGNRVASRRFVR